MRDWDENNPWKSGHNYSHHHKSCYEHDNQGDTYDDYFCDDDSCGNKEQPEDDCRPDQELLIKIFKALCIIKKEIDKCDELLNNPKFGLKEIKREIRNIECAIFSPTFGLREIKAEVSAIESAVFNSTFGLREIKSEVSAIEAAIFNPTFGLPEIKSEVSVIQTAVAGIMDMVDNSTFGLAEIKSEVSLILAIVNDIVVNPVFGLSEIKAEVSAIESAVFNPTFGLLEIKSEISQILSNQESPFLSTGPFLLECEEQVLHLKAVNKTGAPQSVTFFLRDLSTCPPTPAGTFVTGPITPCCASFNELDISALRRRNIEINVARSSLGVLVYAATLTGTLNCPGRKVSEIRHVEWVPISPTCLT